MPFIVKTNEESGNQAAQAATATFPELACSCVLY